MYGISILSLVSTASLRNSSVFLFLEEGKENMRLWVKGMARCWPRGSQASSGRWPVDSCPSQAAACQPVPWKRQLLNVPFGSAWTGLLGTAGGA